MLCRGLYNNCSGQTGWRTGRAGWSKRNRGDPICSGLSYNKMLVTYCNDSRSAIPGVRLYLVTYLATSNTARNRYGDPSDVRASSPRVVRGVCIYIEASAATGDLTDC